MVTVGELISMLDKFDRDLPVLVSVSSVDHEIDMIQKFDDEADGVDRPTIIIDVKK